MSDEVYKTRLSTDMSLLSKCATAKKSRSNRLITKVQIGEKAESEVVRNTF